MTTNDLMASRMAPLPSKPTTFTTIMVTTNGVGCFSMAGVSLDVVVAIS